MNLEINFPNGRDADLIDLNITTPGTTYLGFVARNANADDLEEVAIARIDETTPGITIIKWANGKQDCTHAWADRATLTYKHLIE